MSFRGHILVFPSDLCWPEVHRKLDWSLGVEFGGNFGQRWVSVEKGKPNSISTESSLPSWHSHPSGDRGLSLSDVINLLLIRPSRHVLLEPLRISHYHRLGERSAFGPGLLTAQLALRAQRRLGASELEGLSEDELLELAGIKRTCCVDL